MGVRSAKKSSVEIQGRQPQLGSWVTVGREMEEADEYCPRCDNHFVIEAKTPKAKSELVLVDENDKVFARHNLPLPQNTLGQ